MRSAVSKRDRGGRSEVCGAILPKRLRDSYAGKADPGRPHDSEGARDYRSPASPSVLPAVRPRLLGIRDAAAYLGLSHWTLRDLVWRGDLAEVRIGRRLLFDQKDLDALIERSKRREIIR